MTPRPSGEICADWTEFGHRFQIEIIDPPIRVGAGNRTHRLWDNGEPAYGGQWHYSQAGAERRAAVILASDYSRRIAYLECQVSTLERLAEGKA